MGLRLYRDAHAFGDALAAATGQLYSICNQERLDPAQVLSIERRAADRGHRDISEDAALRPAAQLEIDAWFRAAARHDPQWLFAHSSKVVLAIPEYTDLQKIFLLRSHFAANPGADAFLLVPDARLRRLFGEIFAGKRAMPGPPLPGLRAWARFAKTLARAAIHRARGRKPRVLVFTLSSGAPRPGADAYFGSLATALGARAPTLTVYLASGPAVKLPHDAITAPFESYVPAGTVASTWLSAWLSGPAAAAATGPTAGELAPLDRYLRRAEIRSGEYFMQRLLERGFDALLGHVKPDALVYPFENRSWEKHLLAQAKAHGVARRIAYQHSSITPRHLAFHVEEGEVGPERLPDRVVTIGEHTAALLRGFAPPLADRITAGASLRTARQAVAPPSRPAVLVAISSSAAEALALLRATHAAASLVEVPFIVRTHPTIPIDAMAALFDWTWNVELSAGRTLAEDLSRVSMVAYSSSTVALEGMLYGRLPVFVDIGDVPSGDPVIGEHAFKFPVRGGAALAGAVERIARLGEGELRALQTAASGFAESYLRAPTPAAVRAMTDVMLEAPAVAGIPDQREAKTTPMLITAVIPTRNRPDDLERAVVSVLAQSRVPDELAIIDQSPDEASRTRIESVLRNAAATLKVDYVLDPGIAGLVAAKRAAVIRASGDLVCFLEDDVVLEADYVRRIERAFAEKPDMVGACGVVTGLPPLPPFYFRLFHFFHRGIFRDARVGVHGVAAGPDAPLIPSNYLSGGLSAYRREVFEAVPFDVENGFFALEDIDFSTRVAQRFGPRLYINPNAKLAHHMSAVDRAALGARERRKVREFVVFYKKHRGSGARPAHLALLLTGLFLEAVFRGLQHRALSPVPGYFRGLWDGAHWKLKAVPGTP